MDNKIELNVWENKQIDFLLKESTDCPGYGGGKWAMYSVFCTWWTSFPEDLGKNPLGVPCCPHCGSVLMQAPLNDFIEAAKNDPQNYGQYGITTFIKAHSRFAKRCFGNWNDVFVIPNNGRFA